MVTLIKRAPSAGEVTKARAYQQHSKPKQRNLHAAPAAAVRLFQMRALRQIDTVMLEGIQSFAILKVPVNAVTDRWMESKHREAQRERKTQPGQHSCKKR